MRHHPRCPAAADDFGTVFVHRAFLVWTRREYLNDVWRCPSIELVVVYVCERSRNFSDGTSCGANELGESRTRNECPKSSSGGQAAGWVVHAKFSSPELLRIRRVPSTRAAAPDAQEESTQQALPTPMPRPLLAKTTAQRSHRTHPT